MTFGHYLQVDESEFYEVCNSKTLQNSILNCDELGELGKGYYCVGDFWHALSFLLTGEEAPMNYHPFYKVVYGGQELSNSHSSRTFGCLRYSNPREVSEIVELLDSVLPDVLAARYNPGTMTEYQIHPQDWLESDTQEVRSLIQSCYSGLREFFGDAKAKKSFVFVFFTM
jgi:hypothetical protein